MPPRLSQYLRHVSWRRIVAGVFTVTLFGYLAFTLVTNWREIRTYDWQINVVYLAASLSAYILSLLFGATAWHRIMWSMEHRVPYRQGVKFFLQSNVAKRVPGLIWYAVGRIYLYEREQVSKVTVTMALVLEMVAVITGGAFVFLLTIWGGSGVQAQLERSTVAAHWPWLILPALGLLVIVLWPQGLYRLTNRLLARRGYASLHSQARPKDLLQWSLLQSGGWLSGGLFLYLLAAGVYPDIDPVHAVEIINSWTGAGLAAYVTLLIPLGLGLKELALAYLLSAIIPFPAAVLISLLGRFYSIIGDCISLLIASRL